MDWLRVFLILSVLPWCVPTAYGQLQSSASSVTLTAHVPESLSMASAEIPGGGAVMAGRIPEPRLLFLALGWQLQPGRQFQLEYEVATGRDEGAGRSGRVVLSQAQDAPWLFSLMPVRSADPAILAAWGSSEKDAVGAGGLAILIPPIRSGEPATLRIKLVAL